MKTDLKVIDNNDRIVSLTRAWESDKATLGMIKIRGVEHDPIYTLENPERESTFDSRIPEGIYRCSPYSGTKYKDVYLVNNVPGRTAILFHWGNTEKDSEGCILLGLASGMMGDDPAVMHSKLAVDLFRKLIGPRDFLLLVRGNL